MLRSPRLIIAGRVLAGLTQESLAKAAGISLSVLQAIEQGKSDPKLSTVLAVVDALQAHGVRIVPEDDRIIGGVVALKDTPDSSATRR